MNVAVLATARPPSGAYSSQTTRGHCGDGLTFATDPSASRSRCGQVWQQHLNSHEAIERSIKTFEDCSHSALPQEPDDFLAHASFKAILVLIASVALPPAAHGQGGFIGQVNKKVSSAGRNVSREVGDFGNSLSKGAKNLAEHAERLVSARDAAELADEIRKTAEKGLEIAKEDLKHTTDSLAKLREELNSATEHVRRETEKKIEKLQAAVETAKESLTIAKTAATKAIEDADKTRIDLEEQFAKLAQSQTNLEKVKQDFNRAQQLVSAVLADSEAGVNAAINVPGRAVNSVRAELIRADEEVREQRDRVAVALIENAISSGNSLNQVFDRAKHSGFTELRELRETVATTTSSNEVYELVRNAPGSFHERLRGSTTVETDNAIRIANSEFNKMIKAADGELGRAAETLEKLGERFDNSFDAEAERLIAEIKKSAVFQWAIDYGLSHFMEEPKIIWVGMEHEDAPVFYTNGMLTPKASAIAAGLAISDSLQRRVGIVLNPSTLDGDTGTPGCNDADEALYDRSWPAIFAANIYKLQLPGQDNATTRQLAWILYHHAGSGQQVSIVTHSQGCMQVRNALFTAALFGRESDIRSNVAWLACGSPISDKECWPLPKRYKRVRHQDDFIEPVVGGGGIHKGKWPNMRCSLSRDSG